MEEPGAAAAPGSSRTVWIVVAVIIVAIVVVVAVLAAAGILFPTGEGPQTIKIGTILPVTGALSDFGPRMQNAAELARMEINDADGVLGRSLELIHEDSQTRPSQGANAAAKLVFTDGVPAIVGAASSGVSQAVSTITLENEIVQISPASTSPLFTTFEVERRDSLVDQGLIPEDSPTPDTEGAPGWFWRTAPSDALQGKVAAMIANGDIEGIDGFPTIGIIAVNNPYGKGFAGAFRGTYTGNVVTQVNYTEEQPDYTSELQIIENAGPPDAVLLIGYPEDALTMHRNYQAQGFTWAWQWSEGLKSTEFLTDLDGEGINTDGIVGTSPLPPAGAAFNNFEQRMTDTFDLDLFPFDAHTYDAVMLIALAIEAGGADDSNTIRTNLNAVSSPPGEQVFPGEFAKAKDLIAQGQDIDYEGASGSVNFDVTGETGSDYEVFKVESDAFERVTVVPQTELFAPPAQQSPALNSFAGALMVAGRA